MTIHTDQYSIKALFEQKQTFIVPKYQRGYAWDDEAISDFIEDISECFKARQAGTDLNSEENEALANKTPEKKFEAFAQSSLKINRDIANNNDWTQKIVEKRTEKLAKLATKVFVP